MYHKAQINTAGISLQRTLREVSHSKTFKLFINFLVFESTSNLDKQYTLPHRLRDKQSTNNLVTQQPLWSQKLVPFFHDHQKQCRS